MGTVVRACLASSGEHWCLLEAHVAEYRHHRQDAEGAEPVRHQVGWGQRRKAVGAAGRLQ